MFSNTFVRRIYIYIIVQSLTGEGSALASSPGNTAGIIFSLLGLISLLIAPLWKQLGCVLGYQIYLVKVFPVSHLSVKAAFSRPLPVTLLRISFGHLPVKAALSRPLPVTLLGFSFQSLTGEGSALAPSPCNTCVFLFSHLPVKAALSRPLPRTLLYI